MKDHLNLWKKLSSDQFILNTIQGCSTEFKNLPFQYCTPREYCFSVNECKILEQEINKLLVKGVIQKAEHLPHEFISGIFLRQKKDGSYRMILNLKQLNEFIEYRHFKMETLQSTLNLMYKNTSIDWKEAYYSCNFAEKYRKFLRFLFKRHLYEFTVLPNGFASRSKIIYKNYKTSFFTFVETWIYEYIIY